MKFSIRWLVVAMLSLSACGAAPDVSKVATEQAALKQRVQTLEARVKKLEGKGGKSKSKAPAKAKAKGDTKADPAKAKAAKSKTPAPAPAAAPAK